MFHDLFNLIPFVVKLVKYYPNLLCRCLVDAVDSGAAGGRYILLTCAFMLPIELSDLGLNLVRVVQNGTNLRL